MYLGGLLSITPKIHLLLFQLWVIIRYTSYIVYLPAKIIVLLPIYINDEIFVCLYIPPFNFIIFQVDTFSFFLFQFFFVFLSRTCCAMKSSPIWFMWGELVRYTVETSPLLDTVPCIPFVVLLLCVWVLRRYF